MDEEEKYKIFANKRSDRVYISKRIDSNVIRRHEDGELQTISRPVRIVSKIVTGDDDYRFVSNGEDVVLRTTDGKRLQIKATFYEDLRDIRVLTIQKYSLVKGVPKELYFSFVGPEIETLYNFIRNVALLPLDEQGKRTLEDADVATLRLSRDHDLPAFLGPFRTQEMAISGLVNDSCCLNSAGVSCPRLECGRISL
jgi:hypothetical protein